MIEEVLIPMLIMGLLGIIIAIILVYLDKKLNIKEDLDPRVAEVLEVLPGNNCGACGYANCEAYAKAVSKDPGLVGKCIVGGKEVSEKLVKVLNLEGASSFEKKSAVVHCKGGVKCKDSFDYVNVDSCKAALLLGNKKECKQGCIGFGDCERVCKFDAISIVGGLAHIDLKKCVGCGMCVKECPLNLISLNSKKEEVVIECNTNLDIKKRVKACENSCIGCGICAKVCPKEAITMVNGMPVIDYSKCIKCQLCVKKCPRNVITKYNI